MLLDLNDASSVVEWWAVYPQRHGALLTDWAERRPEHRATILEARRRIQTDPAMRRLMEQSWAGAAGAASLPSLPTHDEQAAGEAQAGLAQ